MVMKLWRQMEGRRWIARIGFYFILKDQGKSYRKENFEQSLEGIERVNSVTIKRADKKQKVQRDYTLLDTQVVYLSFGCKVRI